jgi:hypothetical protein
LVIAIALASIHAFFNPSAAAAADTANCQELEIAQHTSGDEFYDGGAKHGVSGTIDGQDLHQCTQPGPIEQSGTFGWSALGDGGSGSGGGSVIMQIGIGKCRIPGFNCGSDMRFMWAWGRDSSAPGCSGWSHITANVQTLSGWDGAAHDYKVYHKNNYWRFYVGLTEKANIPDSWICWTPTRAWWFSETWDSGDALGGTSGNHLRPWTLTTPMPRTVSSTGPVSVHHVASIRVASITAPSSAVRG